MDIIIVPDVLRRFLVHLALNEKAGANLQYPTNTFSVQNDSERAEHFKVLDRLQDQGIVKVEKVPHIGIGEQLYANVELTDKGREKLRLMLDL